MTAVDRTDATDETFAARLVAWEAAPAVDIAADVQVDVVARWLQRSYGRGSWETVSQLHQDLRRHEASDLLATMKPDAEAQVGPPCKVGDPDPTTEFGRYCNAEEAKDGFWCTRETGHLADWHIAGDGDKVCAVWPVDGAR